MYKTLKCVPHIKSSEYHLKYSPIYDTMNTVTVFKSVNQTVKINKSSVSKARFPVCHFILNFKTLQDLKGNKKSIL